MSNSIQRWHALYTKAGCEKKVANALSRKNIENYCPLKREWNGKKKLALVPLLDCYVFVKILNSDIATVRMTSSVINFIYWLGEPAIIKDEEIEIMKRFMSEYGNIKVEKMPFNENGILREMSAETISDKAHLISVKNSTVKISLPSLGYVLVADVEKSGVDIAPTFANHYTSIHKYQYTRS